MTLVLVRERQYTDEEKTKPIIQIRTDKFKNPIVYSKFEEYYMDLTAEEETAMRKTGRFGFKSVPSFDIEKIEKSKLREGKKRKDAIFAEKATSADRQ